MDKSCNEEKKLQQQWKKSSHWETKRGSRLIESVSLFHWIRSHFTARRPHSYQPSARFRSSRNHLLLIGNPKPRNATLKQANNWMDATFPSSMLLHSHLLLFENKCDAYLVACLMAVMSIDLLPRRYWIDNEGDRFDSPLLSFIFILFPFDGKLNQFHHYNRCDVSSVPSLFRHKYWSASQFELMPLTWRLNGKSGAHHERLSIG